MSKTTEKTIDVDAVDKFTVLGDATIIQYRGPQERTVHHYEIGRWRTAIANPNETALGKFFAFAILRDWGYTLTDTAKPEAKPADAPPAVKENLTTDVPASSVQLRTDAHLSAVVGRVNGLADWLTALESRLASATDELGQWIKRVETSVELAETRLGTRLAAVEKPTQTGVVKVPAPVSHQGLFTDGELRVIDARDSAWRVALTAAGVKWEESK